MVQYVVKDTINEKKFLIMIHMTHIYISEYSIFHAKIQNTYTDKMLTVTYIYDVKEYKAREIRVTQVTVSHAYIYRQAQVEKTVKVT